MFINSLQDDIEQRVQGLIQDYYDWACFARDNYDFDSQTGPFEIAVRYMMLVDKYRVPEQCGQGSTSSRAFLAYLKI